MKDFICFYEENSGNVDDAVDFVVFDEPEDDPLAVKMKDEDEKKVEEEVEEEGSRK